MQWRGRTTAAWLFRSGNRQFVGVGVKLHELVEAGERCFGEHCGVASLTISSLSTLLLGTCGSVQNDTVTVASGASLQYAAGTHYLTPGLMGRR
jgi:hypothetical protein